MSQDTDPRGVPGKALEEATCANVSAAARCPLGSGAGTLLERLPEGVLLTGAEGIVWANGSFVRLYGLQFLERVLGLNFETVYRKAWKNAPQDPVFAQGLEVLRRAAGTSATTYELGLPRDRWVRVSRKAAEEADGEHLSVHVDVTPSRRERRRLHEELAQAWRCEAWFRMLSEYSDDVGFAVRDNVVVNVSSSVTKLLGWSPDDLVGGGFARLVHPDDREHFDAELRNPGSERNGGCRIRALCQDDSYLWVEARARWAPLSPRDDLPVVVINIRSTTGEAVDGELILAHRHMEQLANKDSLTGLVNRRRLEEVLDIEWRRAHRDGIPMSLLMMDIDHFKVFNDAGGHMLGDEVIRRVAAVLASHAQRAGDLAARFGGDEFALLLPSTSREQAQHLAETIRSAVASLDHASARAEHESRPCAPLTLSVGVCSTTDLVQGQAATDLVRCADAALYAAKRTGRNRVVSARDLGRRP